MHAVRVELLHGHVPLLVQVLPQTVTRTTRPAIRSPRHLHSGAPDPTACISIPGHERLGAWRTAPILCPYLDTAATPLIGSQLTWGSGAPLRCGHVWACLDVLFRGVFADKSVIFRAPKSNTLLFLLTIRSGCVLLLRARKITLLSANTPLNNTSRHAHTCPQQWGAPTPC